MKKTLPKHLSLSLMKMISRFKIKISVDGKEDRWADADKVFAHLIKNYMKAELNGKKPEPYKDKVNNFFKNIDKEWKQALEEAYPNVDVEQELNNAKMWLLSNTNQAKKDLKKFTNNWMAKSMRTCKQEVSTNTQAKYEQYKPPVINDEDIASPEEIKEILRRR